MKELPFPLLSAIEDGRCVLFIGSGIGQHFKGKNDVHGPTSVELARELIDHFKINIQTDKIYDLDKIADIIDLRFGRTKLEVFLKQRFSNLEPDIFLIWLTTRVWKAIFTTNYDNSLEKAYNKSMKPAQSPVHISVTADVRDYNAFIEVPIYYLHGALYLSNKSNIIISSNNYSSFKEQRKLIFEHLRLCFATSVFLYIGYSNEDFNWKMLYDETVSEFQNNMPKSYRIAPETDEIDKEILKARNIETIDMSFEDFVSNAKLQVGEVTKSMIKLDEYKDSIPACFLDSFNTQPASVIRLLKSWEYVNYVNFSEKPNTDDFLKGDNANWSLIASKMHFTRDIEEIIYWDELLEFATTEQKQPRAILITSPAGYGITTLLKSIAFILVQEKIGDVYFYRNGRQFSDVDLEFALTLTHKPIFFFIDNAADNITEIQDALQKFRDNNYPALFILGSRKNEWVQTQNKIKVKSYDLESLSDPEIRRLIACLELNNKLGILCDLDDTKRFNLIKVKYQQDLLVTMREITEGDSFDAIIEDEYFGIDDKKDKLIRNIYIQICSFYQHNALIRDQLLAKLNNIDLIKLYESINIHAKGVIKSDTIDKFSGTNILRARHRIIAKIIWQRCGEKKDKEEFMKRSLTELDFLYQTDKSAFEKFVRSDDYIDSIGTLEGKIEFFERACRKDYNNPYVKQHFARMLERSGAYELALDQINDAIKINPSARVLYHSRAVINKSIALNIESKDLARKKLYQSESDFKNCISIYDKDSYSYQGLSELYLGWAKRVENENTEESLNYISKAEETVNNGLKNCRDREALWITSSNIQKQIENRPVMIEALKKALQINPGSIIARFILGKSYRKMKMYNEALEILEYTINNNHDEYRSFVEYALSMLYMNKPYKDIIAILRMSTLFGFKDPRFLSLYGGLIFLSGEFDEANKIFDNCNKYEMSSQEKNKIYFRPPNFNDSSKEYRLKGIVQAVHAGYSWINHPSFPSIFCPGSKYCGVIMKRDLKIDFQLVFTARGAEAIDLKEP